MRWRASLSRLLILFVLAVPILAQASPPDPTWIGGFYDDGDFDDVVSRIVNRVAAEPCPPAVVARVDDPHWTSVWVLAVFDDQMTPAPALLPTISRGPPGS